MTLLKDDDSHLFKKKPQKKRIKKSPFDSTDSDEEVKGVRIEEVKGERIEENTDYIDIYNPPAKGYTLRNYGNHQLKFTMSYSHGVIYGANRSIDHSTTNGAFMIN